MNSKLLKMHFLDKNLLKCKKIEKSGGKVKVQSSKFGVPPDFAKNPDFSEKVSSSRKKFFGKSENFWKDKALAPRSERMS